jgi:hypothetical protein
MDAHGRWEAVLDELAGQLAAQRRSLAAGHPEEIIAYAPPPRLGPLPDDLRRRFEALRSEALAVEAEVTRRRDALGRQLAAMPRRRGKDAKSSPACFIDVSA